MRLDERKLLVESGEARARSCTSTRLGQNGLTVVSLEPVV